MSLDGKIRKIIIGTNPRSDALVYEIGKRHLVGDYEIFITDIVRDENNYYYFGNLRYIVFASKEKDNSEKSFVWKTLENIPLIVECFIV